MIFSFILGVTVFIYKDQDNDNIDDDDKDDCKCTAQEKKQASEAQDSGDLDENCTMKKEKIKKESFSLGCEALCQYIEFDDGESSYIDPRKLQGEVQQAHQRLAS